MVHNIIVEQCFSWIYIYQQHLTLGGPAKLIKLQFTKAAAHMHLRNHFHSALHHVEASVRWEPELVEASA